MSCGTLILIRGAIDAHVILGTVSWKIKPINQIYQV